MRRSGACALVPVHRAHIPHMLRWETDTASAPLWTNRRIVPSALDYDSYLADRLRGYYHCCFIVEHVGRPIGFIYSYDANLVDGYAFVTVFVERTARRFGYGAVASLLMYEYLFATFPLRKLYCDVFEYNGASLKAMTGGGFVVEGAFAEHRWHDGRYHTMYRLALTRSVFLDRLAAVLERHRRLRAGAMAHGVLAKELEPCFGSAAELREGP